MVVATARDLVESGFGGSSLVEGVYLLGTGSNGVCEAMVSMGGIVFGLMHAAAWGYRLPPGAVYQPLPSAAAAKVLAPQAAAAPPEVQDVTLQAAMRTPNFYLLFAGSVGVCMAGVHAWARSAPAPPRAAALAPAFPPSPARRATLPPQPPSPPVPRPLLRRAGLPFIQLGKFMVNDIFGATLGASTAAVAAGFPTIVAAANMGGRLAWGPISDRIGCAKTAAIFGASVPALLLSPFATGIVGSDPETALLLFRCALRRPRG